MARQEGLRTYYASQAALVRNIGQDHEAVRRFEQKMQRSTDEDDPCEQLRATRSDSQRSTTGLNESTDKPKRVQTMTTVSFGVNVLLVTIRFYLAYVTGLQILQSTLVEIVPKL